MFRARGGHVAPRQKGVPASITLPTTGTVVVFVGAVLVLLNVAQGRRVSGRLPHDSLPR